MNCHSITDIVIIRASTKLMEDFFILTVSSSVRSSPSVANAASNI
jgi:hypothetical protein